MFLNDIAGSKQIMRQAELSPPQKGAGLASFCWCCSAAIPIALIVIGALSFTGIMTGVGAICGSIIGLSGVMVLFCLSTCFMKEPSVCIRISLLISTILFAALLTQSALMLSGYQWGQVLTIQSLCISAMALASLAVVGACISYASASSPSEETAYTRA